MLRHLVFLSVKVGEYDAIETELKALIENNEDIKNGVVSSYFGPCGENNEKYNYYFFIDFKDENSRKIYLDHPAHQAFAVNTVIPRLKDSVVSSVLVFDYQKPNRETAISHKISKDSNNTMTGYILTTNMTEANQECSKLPSVNSDIKIKILENCTVENLSQNYFTAIRFCMPLSSEFSSNTVFFTSHKKTKEVSLEPARNNNNALTN